MHRAALLPALAEALKVWLFCVGAAVCYGIIHDQVTVRLCLEYFTIGHPPVFQTTNPTLLALGWGIIATWWVGAILGLPTVFIMRFGQRPAWAVHQLIRPFLVYMVSVGLAACLFGALGYLFAVTGDVKLAQRVAVTLPSTALYGFISAGWAHTTSYMAGFVGALLLWRWIWQHRAAGRIPLYPSRTRLFWRVISLAIVAALWCGALYISYVGSQTFDDTYFPADRVTPLIMLFLT